MAAWLQIVDIVGVHP